MNINGTKKKNHYYSKSICFLFFSFFHLNLVRSPNSIPITKDQLFFFFFLSDDFDMKTLDRNLFEYRPRSDNLTSNSLQDSFPAQKPLKSMRNFFFKKIFIISHYKGFLFFLFQNPRSNPSWIKIRQCRRTNLRRVVVENVWSIARRKIRRDNGKEVNTKYWPFEERFLSLDSVAFPILVSKKVLFHASLSRVSHV